MVCEGKKKRPCGVCESCRSFEEQSDLDLMILRPVDGTLWIERDELEALAPDGVGGVIEKLVGEGFLRGPIPNPAGRKLLPLRLEPSALFRRARGAARFDRTGLARRLENASLDEGERAFVRRITRANHSVEWYRSSVGIGQVTGSDEPASMAGKKAVIPFLARRPAARRRKVVIVEEAERMTEEAQNALLKTLEEPPPDSLLLLTSSRREGLLDTIRSRCEQVRVPPPSPEERESEVDRYFSEIDRSTWESLLLLGEGVPAQAAEIDPDRFEEEKAGAAELLRVAEGGRFGEFFPLLEKWVDELEGGAEDDHSRARRRLSLFLLLARDLAVDAGEGSGAAEALGRAERIFRSAHGALTAVRPGVNLRLLIEEFGMSLWRKAGTEEGGAR